MKKKQLECPKCKSKDYEIVETISALTIKTKLIIIAINIIMISIGISSGQSQNKQILVPICAALETIIFISSIIFWIVKKRTKKIKCVCKECSKIWTM